MEGLLFGVIILLSGIVVHTAFKIENTVMHNKVLLEKISKYIDLEDEMCNGKKNNGE